MISGTAVSESGRGVTRPRDPAANLLFSFVLALALAAMMALQLSLGRPLTSLPLGELLFWGALVLVMNLIPFNEGERSFSLDTPILLAVAFLYPPAVACGVAFVGSMDIREILGRVPLSRAIFNRTQIAISVLVAGVVFQGISEGSLEPWPRAALGTAAALIAFNALNMAGVAYYTALRARISLWSALRALTIGPFRSFLATYLGYGVLALVLAHLFLDVGPWAVTFFLIPLFVARQMLVRGEALSKLTVELRHRERLLERLFDKIIEERRDERLRIATGLHDDVLQSLIRVSQLTSFISKQLSPESSAGRDAVELANLSQATINKLRDVVSDLQRSPVGRGGLIPALRALASDLRMDWRRKVTVKANAIRDLASEAQVVGYQATREAVVNALKHSGGTRIEIEAGISGEHLVLAVSDNGCGFAPDLVDESMHFGLGLMRTRVERAEEASLLEACRVRGPM